MYSKSLELDLDTALESLDNILMTDDEKYASMEAYLDELVSHDSFEEVSSMFESVYNVDYAMEEDNGGNKNGFVSKLRKALAWLKNKFFNIVNAIKNGIEKIIQFFKRLFGRKFKSKKQKIAELEAEIKILKQRKSSVEEDRDYYRKETSNLRNSLSQAKDQRNTLLEKSNVLANSLEKEKAKRQELENENLDLKNENKNLKHDTNIARASAKYNKDNYDRIKDKFDQEKFDNDILRAEKDAAEKERDEESHKLHEAEDRIRRLEKQIDFLAGKDFEKTLIEKFKKEMSEKELSALYFAVFGTGGIYRKLEENSKRLVNDLNKIRDWSESYISKIDSINDDISDNVGSRVNWDRLAIRPEEYFDKNKISKMEKTTQTIKTNFSNAITLLKKKIDECEKTVNDFDPEKEANDLRPIQIYLNNLQKLLADTSKTSSEAINFMMRSISSIKKAQDIYLSAIDGKATAKDK